MAGKVWLVGAGPGDPGLITVRAVEVLGLADVVLHDALAHPALLEHAPQAELRHVGKRYGEDSPSQEAITAQIVALAREGKRVVRLKGGDPFMFARGSEEALALVDADIDFEVVPGISSPVAASAYAGMSLTHRDMSSSVTFITGSDRAGKEWSPESWQKLATATDTICVFMGMRRIEAIARAILDGGRSPSTPAAVIQWGARSEQRVVTGALDEIAALARARNFSNPALIVIGEVVRLREKLRWFDNRPLFGKRILIPRPIEQAKSTARAVRERGGEPIVFPVIEIVPPPEPERLRRAATQASAYDWVLFTSSNGVERFFAALAAEGRDARAFGSAKVGVIGPKTAAALARFGVRPDTVASEYIGESLAKAVLESGPAHRVLIARALVARDALPEMLRGAGVSVDVVPAYETVAASSDKAAELRGLLDRAQIDAVLFTSSSMVSSTVELLGAEATSLLRRITVASIGPVTTGTASELGVAVDVTADTYTVDGLLDALERHSRCPPAGTVHVPGGADG
jgi:uroporphyrinogen III methyltransferase/synthase